MTQSALITGMLAALLAGAAPHAPAPGRPAADTSLASLYGAREKVWRDFFGDPEGLAQALPPGFVAIEPGDTVWADRAATLARSRASVRGGTRLVSLRFPHNRVQRYGNVAVIQSRYEMVLEGATRNTIRGNVTEIFIWTGTSWSHPSWHLDYDPEPEPAPAASSVERRPVPGDTAGLRRVREAYQTHQGEFDYLLGDWTFSAESKQWGRFGGRWSAVRLAEGQILDEWRIVGDSGETVYVTTTLRAYNALLDRWELVGMDAGNGLQDVGTGRKVGDEIHIEQRFGVMGPEPSLSRIRYYDIQADRFSWTADRSIDGGRTWIPGHLKIEARRIGPARTMGPIAVPRR